MNSPIISEKINNEEFTRLATSKTRTELAAHFHCHINTITRHLKANGMKAYVVPKMDKREFKQCVHTMTTYEMAKHFGVHFRTILNYKRRWKIGYTYSKKKTKPVVAAPAPKPRTSRPGPSKDTSKYIPRNRPFDQKKWNPIQ